MTCFLPSRALLFDFLQKKFDLPEASRLRKRGLSWIWSKQYEQVRLNKKGSWTILLGSLITLPRAKKATSPKGEQKSEGRCYLTWGNFNLRVLRPGGKNRLSELISTLETASCFLFLPEGEGKIIRVALRSVQSSFDDWASEISNKKN